MLPVSMNNRISQLDYPNRTVIVKLSTHAQFIGVPPNSKVELLPNRMKKTKTAIFFDFRSLLLISSSKIYATQMNKN